MAYIPVYIALEAAWYSLDYTVLDKQVVKFSMFHSSKIAILSLLVNHERWWVKVELR